MIWQKICLILLCTVILCQPEDYNKTLELITTKRSSCYLVARSVFAKNERQIQYIMEDLPKGKRKLFIDKVYVKLSDLCFQAITQTQVQDFYGSSNDFRLQNYDYLAQGIDFRDVSLDLTLSQREEAVLQFNRVMQKRFDKTIEKHQYQNDL